MPNGGIQERAHGAEKNIDLNQKRTTDGFKRDYRGMAAGPKLCADHHPMRASIDGFRGLEERQRQAELLALSTLRPPAGSRVTTALAAHHCRTRCALWRNFFWTTRRSTNRPWGSLPVRLKRHLATYSVELALQIIDAPAVKGERHDAVLPIELGDLVRDGVRIDGRSDRRNESEFRPRGVEGEHSNVPM